MSPVEVNANSNHGTSTVAPATATMNGSTEPNSKPKASSQNSELRKNDSANPNITSNANLSPTRRLSLPTIRLAGWNIRKASQSSASTAPASLESTTARNRSQSIRESIRQWLRFKSFSLQQSFKRQQRNKNEETNHEVTNQEEVVFSERFALNLPPWISPDKSEIDYIRRTQSKLSPDPTHLGPLSSSSTSPMSHLLTFLVEEFLGTAGESMLLRLPPLHDEEDEEELNLHADWADPTLDTGNVKLDQNNTKNTATTPITPENEAATSNTQQQTISGDPQNSAISTSKNQNIYEANEISIMIACFQQSTETSSESPSNNNNNAGSGSRAINMSRRQSQPLSYYWQPRRRE
jgi:hypothetical protein